MKNGISVISNAVRYCGQNGIGFVKIFDEFMARIDLFAFTRITVDRSYQEVLYHMFALFTLIKTNDLYNLR